LFQLPEGATFNRSIPQRLKNGKLETDSCHMYNYINGSYSNNTITCPNGWYYDPKPIRSSVVTEVKIPITNRDYYSPCANDYVPR